MSYGAYLTKAKGSEVLSVCLSPSIQKTYIFSDFTLGEVNPVQEAFFHAGGKGMNLVRSLNQLGLTGVYLGQGGCNGNEFSKYAGNEGLRTILIPSSKEIRTCTTLMAIKPNQEDSANSDHDSKGLFSHVTELVEECNSVDSDVPNLLFEKFESHLSTAKAVCISGTRTQGYPEDFFPNLLAAAQKQEKPVFLDIKGTDLLLSLREEPAVVKVNFQDFLFTFMPEQAKILLQQELYGSHEALSAVKQQLLELSEDYETSFIVTRGPRPILAAEKGEVQEFILPRFPSHQLKNPIGSGDAFMAGLISLWIGKNENADILSLGIKFGILCAQSSARTLKPAELDPAFLEELSKLS